MKYLICLLLMISSNGLFAQKNNLIRRYQKEIIPKSEVFLLNGEANKVINLLDNELLDLSYQVFGREDSLLVKIHSLMAEAYYQLGSIEDSKDYAKTAICISSTTKERERIVYLTNEIDSLSRLKSLNHTEISLLRDELSNLKYQYIDQDHPYGVWVDYQLGNAYFLLKDYKEAVKVFSAIAAFNIYLLPVDDPLTVQIHEKLAKCYFELGDQYQAFKHTHIVINEMNEKFRVGFKSLSFREREDWVGEHYPLLAEMFWIAVSSIEESDGQLKADFYNLMLQIKGIQLKEIDHIYEVFENTNNGTLGRYINEWKALRDQFAHHISRKEIDQARIVHQKVDEKEREMIRAASVLPINLPVVNSYEQVKYALDEDEAAVEIVRAEYQNEVKYIALVNTLHTDFPELVIIDNGDELEKEIYHKYLSSIQYHSTTRSTQKINSIVVVKNETDEIPYNNYWRPIEKYLNNIKKVYLSADGIYHRVNMETLFDGEKEQYLYDSLQVVLVESTREIPLRKYKKEKRFYTSNPVLVANPRYDFSKKNEILDNVLTLDTDKSEKRFLQYISDINIIPPLPHTQKEAMNIQSAMGGAHKVDLLTGKKATENAIKQLNRPSVLHIATHGYWNKDEAENPMNHVGMLLAGVVDAEKNSNKEFKGEDGILTAYEAANLDLLGTEQVVLSACETGLGEMILGEGVYGMQRGFRMAGVHSIMMSLWSVDDKITQELMTMFYKQKSQGKDTHSALRAAQKIIKSKYPEPQYWGAFVIQGL